MQNESTETEPLSIAFIIQKIPLNLIAIRRYYQVFFNPYNNIAFTQHS